jgi:hypothetical protein
LVVAHIMGPNAQHQGRTIYLIGVVTIAAALTADVRSGAAQQSFFNERFCTLISNQRNGT